jgi:hypothetical protein
MSEGLERLDRRITQVRQATLICAASLAVVAALLGAQLAVEIAGLLSASHRLGWEAARRQRLTSALARLPQTWPTADTGERLSPDATFVALAGHVGALARRTGSILRTLKRAVVETQDDELRPPTGEAEVGAQLQLDTTYWSGLRFLRALDGLPLPVTPTQVDLENLFPASPGREPRLALRLELLACGMKPKGLVLRSDAAGLRRAAGD